MDRILFSSKGDEWPTPQHVFDRLNEEFNFNLDPCATDENHKCEKYYTIQDDGLSQNWGGTEFSAILHIAKFQSGWRNHFMRAGMTTQLLCS